MRARSRAGSPLQLRHHPFSMGQYGPEGKGPSAVADDAQDHAAGRAPRRLDENPCRPRHFKPAPCAPLALDGPVKQVLDTSRNRLLVAGTLFALVFLVVALRLVEVVVLHQGSAESHIARIKAPHPMPLTMNRADIVERNRISFR